MIACESTKFIAFRPRSLNIFITHCRNVLKVDPNGAVVVRPDQIKDAGLGLKAIVDIPSNTVIASLSGRVHFQPGPVAEEDIMPHDSIVFPVDGYALLTDAVLPQDRTLGSFVNDVRTYQDSNQIMTKRRLETTELKTNAEFRPSGPCQQDSIVVSTSTILKHEYVYAYYGPKYTDKKRKIIHFSNHT
jgi:hypothetical protein